MHHNYMEAKNPLHIYVTHVNWVGSHTLKSLDMNSLSSIGWKIYLKFKCAFDIFLTYAYSSSGILSYKPDFNPHFSQNDGHRIYNSIV